jgi:hypothetical protein
VPEQSTEELGDRIKPDNITKYNQLRPLMKCSHFPVVVGYGPSADRKTHLLFRCPAFAKADAFQDSKIQADLLGFCLHGLVLEYKTMKEKATAQQ